MSTPSNESKSAAPIAYTLIDAFTSTPFGGNSASIIVQDERKLSAETMQLIAREFNLSETAFLSPIKSDEDSSIRTYSLRWFTPSVEVALCGHATLGSAGALFENDKSLKEKSVKTLHFETMSGTLKATRLDDGRIELSFPAGQADPVAGELKDNVYSIIQNALGEGIEILGIYGGIGTSFYDYLLVEVDTKGKDLADLQVKTNAFTQIEKYEIIIVTTKCGKNQDFISRVFAPKKGIAEDPVTGSAHCLSGPYWSKKLHNGGGKSLIARQVSARGGDIEVVWDDEKALCYLRGAVVIMGRGELFV